MALAVVTLRPNSTAQLGLGTVVGAATADAALAASGDTAYVQLTARSRLDSQVIRVGFPTPTIPAGAKVYSVGLRRRIQTVVVTDPINAPPPVCHHWFRCLLGVIAVTGQAQQPTKTFFNSTCPTATSTTSSWVEENLGTFTTAPGGAAWDPATTLNGMTYDIGRGDDGVSILRVSAVYLDITYQQASTITVTGPTGTSTTTKPTVNWNWTSPDSQPQQASRVAVYTAAQVALAGFQPFVTTPLQASGWTPGTTWTPTSGYILGENLQWTLTSDLTDGGYSAYVQGTARWSGTGDFPTSVASTSWTRAATPVTPPPTAVLSSATFDAPNLRNALTFVPSASSPATTAFTVQASHDNGVTWPAIPSLTYVPANGMTPVTKYDYSAPLNAATLYRVISYNTSSSALSAAISPSNQLSVTPTGDQHQLIHPLNPLLNTIIPVAAPKSGAGIKVTKRRTQGTFQPLSGTGTTVLPIVVNGPNSGDEYELELLYGFGTSGMLGRDELTYLWPAMDQLDKSGSVLLWKKPDGTQLWVSLGPGASGRDTEETYDAVPGNTHRVYWRRRKLTFTEQAIPAYY